MLTLEQIGIIVAIVVSVSNLLFTIYKGMLNPPPYFILQRFKKHFDEPIESNWSIQIMHPNKPINKCIILYNDAPLPWWNTNELYYEASILVGGQEVFRIPVEIEKDDAEIKIMDDKKTLKRIKFKEITTVPRTSSGSFFSTR
jgi:hypothetical protein